MNAAFSLLFSSGINAMDYIVASSPSVVSCIASGIVDPAFEAVTTG